MEFEPRADNPAMRLSNPILLLLAVMVAGGCGKLSSQKPVANETFDWRGRPITFAPPPSDWRREGINSGMLGVYFVLTGSVGERILLADHYLVSDRDRSAALGDLLGKMDDLDDRELAQQISLARWRTEDPISSLEAGIARECNYNLDQATLAVFAESRSDVRRYIQGARNEAGRLHITLADVLPRMKFDPAKHREGEWKITSEGPAVVAGLPAYRVDYTWRSPEQRLYHGRELYFVADNHPFTASFHGLQRNLPLFDRIVDSIALPPLDPTAGTVAVTSESH